jgi:hypothetical protein
MIDGINQLPALFLPQGHYCHQSYGDSAQVPRGHAFRSSLLRQRLGVHAILDGKPETEKGVVEEWWFNGDLIVI